ncbi:MAG: outer membrane beta-barrel protein [Sulfuricurvum sp.]|uniref:outer membrane beta-barrel protein n=1 Tax=Sulfuricurvum sp. TaxID=2025608 RepID=UPI00262035DC|nr:outer membrane beta-barrel protein [Sulfuricurvum sp.]MDD2368324.1 outer membrane beta-barrel protein [Sulfuricurvum sp.]MDD2950660.1 outer membrane beta-barrel protein [Sulfuricurvum sp.]MDD5117929.1 outer membrane beta-barrel protein [Sulfuricurvum sp.]
MKKHKLIVLFLSLAVASFAHENEFSFGLSSMSMDYMEYKDNGDKADSEKADTLPGFTLSYKTSISNGGFIDADFSQYYGNTNYVGSALNNPNGQYGDVTATTESTISDGSIGYSEQKIYDNYLVFMRLGIGYRNWERALSDGHTEEYKWPYGTVKLGFLGNMTGNDTLGLSAEYHQAFSPQMKSNKYGTFDLGRTDGFSIIVPWEHTLSANWALKFTYMYQTWDIKKSNTLPYQSSQIVWEPRSESNFNTFNAALVYRY